MATEDLNPLEMSDDEINDAIARELAQLDSQEDAEDNGLQEEDSEEVDTAETDSEDDTDDSEEEPSDDIPEVESAVDDDTDASEEEGVDSTQEMDYKSQYEEILKPFKANGKEIQIDNVDDARRLMQMGANYAKKMSALKPNLKLMKMLENNELLDESKLSYLIDLARKDPAAIKKLVSESGVDPLDIDVEADSGYKPNTYTVSDKEVELDGILEELRDTDSFNTTIDIIGNKWDEKSKGIIVNEPNIIRTINEHIQSGIYDIVSNAVERERVLGKLDGLSDLEAYKQVGDAINAQGGFAHLQKQVPANTLQSKLAPNNVNRAKKPSVDPTLTSKKKAASSTKSAPRVKTEDSFNPLSMSDEEFEKLATSKFY